MSEQALDSVFEEFNGDVANGNVATLPRRRGRPKKDPTNLKQPKQPPKRYMPSMRLKKDPHSRAISFSSISEEFAKNIFNAFSASAQKHPENAFVLGQAVEIVDQVHDLFKRKYDR